MRLRGHRLSVGHRPTTSTSCAASSSTLAPRLRATTTRTSRCVSWATKNLTAGDMQFVFARFGFPAHGACVPLTAPDILRVGARRPSPKHGAFFTLCEPCLRKTRLLQSWPHALGIQFFVGRQEVFLHDCADTCVSRRSPALRAKRVQSLGQEACVQSQAPRAMSSVLGWG
jgi:hypothetical protein